KRLRNVMIKPNEATQQMIRDAGGSELKDGIRGADLLKRPEMDYDMIQRLTASEIELEDEVKEQVEIQVKYEGYIEKSLQQVAKLKKMEDKKIPENIDYHSISGIATEARMKLSELRPLSIAKSSRILGVNNADISILLVYIEQGRIAKVSV